jgi:hypothetical protein
MTTLARLLGRFLPRPLIPFALALLYAAMLLAIAGLGTSAGGKLVYIDVARGR